MKTIISSGKAESLDDMMATETTNPYVACIVKYFQFRGRSTRSEFWWYTFTYLIIWVSLCYICRAFYYQPPTQLLFSIIVLFHLIPFISVLVRRVHDTGKSGWLVFWALLIFSPVLIVICVMPGTEGTNDYGDDPKFIANDDQIQLTSPKLDKRNTNTSLTTIEEIEKLATLRDKGILTDAEFASLKTKAINV